MKALISQPELVQALNQVSRSLSSKVQLPVLNNVLLAFQKEGITLAATNLEVGIRVNLGAKVESEGSLTVPARQLSEFVANLSGQNITLEQDESKLVVSTLKHKGVFAGIDAAEFPVLPQSEEKGQGIKSQLVAQIAASVAYAAAVDESRPVLTGVKFETGNGELVVTATDGFRLARKKLPVSDSISNLILPAKTIHEVAKIASELKEDSVHIQSVEKNNQVIFSCGHTDLISRVLEGNYPDTNKIIPTDLPTEVVLDRQEFVKSLKAMSIFARDNNNIVRFEIRNSKFKIKSQASQAGEGEVELDAETSGEGDISFNYKFISDALGSFGSEQVKLQIKDHLSPGILRPDKDDSLLALVMPVRI